jgi:excinuclease ABC subunit A
VSPIASSFSFEYQAAQKPDVDEIVGLSPAISIDQKSAGRNPRSTVATITEIYDYLRVLYARVGKPYCVDCGHKIEKLSNEEIMNFVLERVRAVDYKKVKKEMLGVEFSHEEVHILSPLVRGRKGEYYQMLYDMLGKGYTEALVDGKRHSLREQIVLDKNKKHEIQVTLIEGLTQDEVAAKLAEKDLFSAQEFLSKSKKFDYSGYPLLINKPLNTSLEGYLFPDTYRFNKGATPEDVLTKMLDNFSKRLASIGVTSKK